MTFFQPGQTRDQNYSSLRDGRREIVVEGREFVEALWSECRGYVDDDLPEKARQAYVAGFWELYLAHSLMSHGIRLVPRSEREPARQGPDLLARDPRVWIEATAPAPGQGANEVPEGVPGEARSVPDDKIILRYRSAIAAKIDQLKMHRDRGWIEDGDATVIALNGSQIPSARAELTIPRVVRSVLPFGHETFHLDIESFEVVGRSFRYRKHVEKSGGAKIEVDVFLDKSSARVSALLASCVDELNRPDVPGGDFVLIHNPKAAHPLPRGWLPVGEEYWVEDDQLHQHVHEP